jgi:hypothetical protein
MTFYSLWILTPLSWFLCIFCQVSGAVIDMIFFHCFPLKVSMIFSRCVCAKSFEDPFEDILPTFNETTKQIILKILVKHYGDTNSEFYQ